ncbi:MAG: cyclohexanone monooxygenase, partial [Psychrobacillus psychrodurans]
NSVLDHTPEQRREFLEAAWEKGGWAVLSAYNDLLTNEEGNLLVAEFVRSKIREIVKDPETAEKLLPDHYYGTKRAIIDTDYFETYNRENVRLVDVKKAPIEEITSNGIRTEDGEYELDVIVFATGFDGMTGSLFKIDIRGRDNVALKEKWENGAKTKTYLGLTTAGFPNLFMLTGPESPSVLGNMPAAIEQHVEWVMDCIEHLQNNEIEVLEAKTEAEEKWSQHCRELADSTLYTKTESWYTGANIEGKAKGFQIYVGGYNEYRKICDDVALNGYDGFTLDTAKANKVI